MAVELVTCPQCRKKLRVPEELLGKQVKCPTCTEVFTADPSHAAEPLPPSEEPVPPPAARRRANDDPAEPRPRPSRVVDDEDDDDRPRRRRLRAEDDDDDDDDDDDYRRRRRRRRRDLTPHRASMILTFGILSLLVLPFVFGPMAWVMGNSDLQEMRAGRMDPEGEGSTNAGRICGMIATLLSVGGTLLCCLFYAVMIASAGAGGASSGFVRRGRTCARLILQSGAIMPELVNCPHCEKKLRVPDTLLGKPVKCPTCGKTFNAGEASAAAPPSPPAAEEPPPRPATRRRPPDEEEAVEEAPRRRRPADDEDEDRPRRRARDDDDDEEDDDRPRRRRAREDDDADDDRPRKRRRRGGGSGAHRGGLVLALGIAGLVLACCPLAGWILGGIAYSMGNKDLQAMGRGKMDEAGRGLTSGGRICGMIALALATLVFVVNIILYSTGAMHR